MRKMEDRMRRVEVYAALIVGLLVLIGYVISRVRGG